MPEQIDCRNLACPAPVLQTKKFVEANSPQALTIIVDNAAAKENVSRFLKSKGYEAGSEEKDGLFYVTGTIGENHADEQSCPACEVMVPQPGVQQVMILCATDRMGHGDDELGKKLMINFIKTLPEMGKSLWRLIFVNNGVKLAVKGSAVYEELMGLENDGVTILVCGTCLEHFQLMGKPKVGQTTNMLDIVTAMELATSVINL